MVVITTLMKPFTTIPADMHHICALFIVSLSIARAFIAFRRIWMPVSVGHPNMSLSRRERCERKVCA
jgi:hypothetical protein